MLILSYTFVKYLFIPILYICFHISLFFKYLFSKKQTSINPCKGLLTCVYVEKMADVKQLIPIPYLCLHESKAD